MKRIALLAAFLCIFLAVFVFGAASIRRPIANAPADPPPPRNPWSPADVAGLMGSAGIRAMAGNLRSVPLVVLETDRTFALSLPAPGDRVHYVVVPKKD